MAARTCCNFLTLNEHNRAQAIEIVVMAPDIAQYAPYIDSVFGATPRERSIPYSVAALALTQQPLVETLLEWLLLPDERFEAPTVIGWLEIPAIQSRFGLGDESIERVRQWVDESGIRWGLDAQHKAELGLPANGQNTWAFGFDRLFLGYAMPTDSDLFHGVAPFSNIEGSEALWLGQLREFIAQLTRWRKELAMPANLQEWQGRINRQSPTGICPIPDHRASNASSKSPRWTSTLSTHTSAGGSSRRNSRSLSSWGAISREQWSKLERALRVSKPVTASGQPTRAWAGGRAHFRSWQRWTRNG